MTPETTTPVTKPKGRPPGYSPSKADPRPKLEVTLEDVDNYLVVKIPKNAAIKILLKNFLF